MRYKYVYMYDVASEHVLLNHESNSDLGDKISN